MFHHHPRPGETKEGEILRLAERQDFKDAILYDFDIDDYELKKKHKLYLDEIVQFMADRLSARASTLNAGDKNSAWIVSADGYASHTGGGEHNKVLSDLRETGVAEYLMPRLKYKLSPLGLFQKVRINLNFHGFDDTPVVGENARYRCVRVVAHRPDLHPSPISIPPTPPSKIYVGLGAKEGGFFVFAGMRNMGAYLFNLDYYADNFWLDASIKAYGFGLGGGAALGLVIAAGGRRPTDFLGIKFSRWDFNLTLGGRWKDVVRVARDYHWVKPIVKTLEELKWSKGALRQVLKLSPGQWNQLVHTIRNIIPVLGIDTTKPSIHFINIPLAGWGAEVDIFKYYGTVDSIF